jgi:uncharacterized membrane protein YkvA (DUF1232 family)
MEFFSRIRAWAKRIKRDAVTLWFAYRHPDTPLFVKALCVFVVAYALSPIDLIPDFIPVLGYVDDALLLLGLIWLAIRLLPVGVVASSRVEADRWMVEQGERPRSYAGATFIVAIWVLAGCMEVVEGLTIGVLLGWRRSPPTHREFGPGVFKDLTLLH